MSWQQDITEQLLEVQNVAVRFDTPQELTNAEKQRARTNIDIGASATSIDGINYKIVL